MKKNYPNDPDNGDLVRRLTNAMREADRMFENEGGSTRHYVMYCLLPMLNKNGLIVSICLPNRIIRERNDKDEE